MASTETPKDSGRKLFYGLFIFPLLIAVGMAVLLCTVVLLTRETETPESLIAAIKTGSPSKRWQKAFELSNELNQGRGLIREAGLMHEIIHIVNDRAQYDAKTRSFMAVALARFEEPEAAAALEKALHEEADADVQLHLIWALGVRKFAPAREFVGTFLGAERDDLKVMAAYVLGVLGDPASRQNIAPLLNDDDRDVRWNAALSLARLGSDEGYQEILKMMDRKTLSSLPDLSDSQIEEIMVNAVKGAALLHRGETLSAVQRLAQEDPSLKVRQTALEVLQHPTETIAA